MRRKKKIDLANNSTSDRVYAFVAKVLLVVIMIALMYPLWVVVVCSFSNPNTLYEDVWHLIPRGFRLGSYKLVFENERFMRGFLMSIFYTVVGTGVNLVLTVMAAYPLSRRNLKGRSVLMSLMVFTMYFSGGLVPSYILLSNLHMLDSIWAILLPTGISTYNVIIMRTYFINSIPVDLEDAAVVDGCTNFRFLLRIVLPLSAPIMVVIALYYGVGRWNDYFNAMIYLNNQKLWPMQLVLREILLQNDMSSTNLIFSDFNAAERMMDIMGMKYSVIVVATLPILLIYPFCQKFFAKGVMIGSLKG